MTTLEKILDFVFKIRDYFRFRGKINENALNLKICLAEMPIVDTSHYTMTHYYNLDGRQVFKILLDQKTAVTHTKEEEDKHYDLVQAQLNNKNYPLK
jgi:hypothetical protein